MSTLSKWGLFAAFAGLMLTSNIGKLYLPEAGWMLQLLISAGLLALNAALVLAFDRVYTKASLGIRWVAFILLNLVFLGIPLLLTEYPAAQLQELAIGTYPILTILALAYFLFAGKEPTNLILFAASNRKSRLARLDHRLIIAALFAWIIFVFVLLNEYVRMFPEFETQLGIRPSHILLVSAVFLTLTSQNHFIHLKKNLSQPA